MKLKIWIFTVASILSVYVASAQAFQWVKGMGGSSDDFGFAVTTDMSGYVYTTGRFEGVADFDAGPGSYTLSAVSMSDVFICKMDAAGNFLWAKSFGGLGDDDGYSIKTDPSGNVYVTGIFSNTVDFDPGPGTYTISSVSASFDMFIVKLDANGELVWVKTIGDTQWDSSQSLSIDALGDVVTTGYFNGTVDFDPGAGTFFLTGMSSAADAFVLKLDSAGNFIWAKQFASTSSANAKGYSLTTDVSNNIYSVGFFYGVVDFDPGPGTNTLNAVASVFITKLDAGGNFVWATSYPGLAANSVNVDVSGNVYVVGENMGSGTGMDIVVSKINSGGTSVWLKQAGGVGYDKARGATLDNMGNLYFVGDFDDVVDLDPGPGTFTFAPVLSSDIYISKWSPSGNFIGAAHLGGNGQDFAYSIACNSAGDIYTTGFFSETADFDPGPATYTMNSSPSGYHNIYVHKMSVIVGVEEQIENEKTTLYPNPSAGELRLNTNGIRFHNYSISDVSGKVIRTGNIESGECKISVTDLQKGLYFLTLEHEGNQQTHKIIVE